MSVIKIKENESPELDFWERVVRWQDRTDKTINSTISNFGLIFIFWIELLVNPHVSPQHQKH